MLQQQTPQTPALTRGNGLIRCKKCGEEKGISSFSYQSPAGWHTGNVCKTCQNSSVKG